MFLTKRQKELYDFLDGYLAQHGYAPTLEEIGTRFKLNSLATVHKHLTNLEQKGLISSELEAGTAVRAGRPRRCYAIAPAGVRALNDAKAAAERLYAGLRWPLRVPR